jgi:hypothetical protein
MRLFIMPLPAPDGAVLGVDNWADVAEAALGEDARRGVRFGKRVGANGANVLGEGEAGERLGRLGCVAFALVLRVNAVSNLHDAIGRRPFKAATADGAAGFAMHDGKSVPPRIHGFGSPHGGEPLRRDVDPILRPHRIDHGESFFSGLRNEDQGFCGEMRGGHVEIVTCALRPRAGAREPFGVLVAGVVVEQVAAADVIDVIIFNAGGDPLGDDFVEGQAAAKRV